MHIFYAIYRNTLRERCVPLQDSKQTEVFNRTFGFLRTCLQEYVISTQKQSKTEIAVTNLHRAQNFVYYLDYEYGTKF